MSLVVRDAELDDAVSVRQLLVVFGYSAGALDHVDQRLARRAENPRVLVAERDERIVGVGSLTVSTVLERAAPQGRVTVLVVDESERRRGTGLLLVESLEQAARDAGCSRLELTSAHVLPDAHAFWRAAGYTETGLRFVKTLADEAPWQPLQ